MEDSTEELEPLFDYRRVQPVVITCLDDDDSSDALASPSAKRMKTSQSVVEVVDEDVKVIEIKNSDNKDEEDWLPPPPKPPRDFKNLFDEDPTIKELRLKKQELQTLAKSAGDILRDVEESVRRDLSSSVQDDQPSKPPSERTKIIISFQAKDGCKQIRVYKNGGIFKLLVICLFLLVDEKFERLFKMYADNVKLDVQNLVFLFDGDKVSLTATPDDLDMEDNDIIEVNIKKR